MVNDNLKNTRQKVIKKYAFFLILEVLLIFLLLALFSGVLVLFSADNSFVPLFSALSLSIGTLVGSYLSGKVLGSKALIVGGINGFLLFVLVSVIAAIIGGGKITLSSLFNFLIILLSSVVGAVFGVNAADKRRIK